MTLKVRNHRAASTGRGVATSVAATEWVPRGKWDPCKAPAWGLQKMLLAGTGAGHRRAEGKGQLRGTVNHPSFLVLRNGVFSGTLKQNWEQGEGHHLGKENSFSFGHFNSIKRSVKHLVYSGFTLIQEGSKGRLHKYT